ncbi:hypothetical protein F5882DRAFT_387724 [Hyaloscypha sp. PMI_1271]|nr:hypothetical protein F5882DRAFT_387724 [Hyaloscypha sp. PMI_1271]
MDHVRKLITIYANLCTIALSYILVEKAKSNVKDYKEAILKLYDSLLIYAKFTEVDEDDFYELLDKAISSRKKKYWGPSKEGRGSATKISRGGRGSKGSKIILYNSIYDSDNTVDNSL